MNSKQMQTCSIIWNYSSYKAGIFLCKISPVQSITNIVLLIFLFYFFVNNILFSNVYISVNTIFEYYIGHPLSTCPTEGMEGGHPRCVQVHTRGRGVSRLMCTYALTGNYSFHVFFLRCLLLTFIKKGVFLYIFESPQKTGVRFS